MKDITTKADVEHLVDAFYQKALTDKLIGPIFNEVAQLDVAAHMPIMYSFWESVLLGGRGYQGDPMTKHLQLDKKMKLTAAHFERWLMLWESTVRGLFNGANSDEAVKRAKSIAALMQHKLKAERL